MADITFLDFNRECQANGVAISEDVFTDPYYRVSPRSKALPNDWYRAIAAAGNVLRLDPARALINESLPTDLLTEPTIAQTTLVGMLNASRDRIAGDTSVTSFTYAADAPGHCLCHSLEPNFAHTVEAMEAPEDIEYPLGWRIITSGDRAIAFQKENGAERTLSMVDFIVNGKPFPKGSVFRTGFPWRVERKRRSTRIAVSSEMIGPIAFLRLSAFAIPPVDRATEFPAMVDQESNDIVRNWPLERMQYAAQRAIQRSVRLR